MDMRRKFSREVAAAGLIGGVPGPAVTEADLAPLPEAARRYLRFMGVVGRARDTTFRLHAFGRFKPRRDSRWLDAEVWQFSSRPDVARIFHMRLRMFGVPVYGRDLYAGGRGRMLVRPLDLFTLEDARGAELDVGELVTYLNDAVLLAPSMLLAPQVAWAEVDDGAFDVSLSDHGVRVEARVLLDARGAPRDFRTIDRFHGRERTEWSTPVEGWHEVGGRMLPAAGRAVWMFPEGPFPYAELRFEAGSIAFNVRPGA